MANFAGDTTTLATPLARTQQFGVALSHMITSSVDPGTATAGEVEVPDDMTSTGDSKAPKLSAIIVDSFVAPVHQQLNYGRIIDAKCHDKYIEVLKGGPYDDISDARDDLGDCDEGLSDYAGDIADGSWLVGFFFYSSTVTGLAAILLVFAGMCWFYVCKLVWSSFMSMLNVLRAIPGRTDPLIRDLCSILYSMIGIVGSMVMLGVVMLVIKSVFASDGNVVIKVMVVNMLEIVGIIGLLVSLWRSHKGEEGLRAKINDWMRSKRSEGASAIGQWAGRGARRMVRSGGRKLTGLGRRRMVSAAAAVVTGGASVGVTRAAKMARMASAARRASASYRQIRTGGGAPQGQSKITTAGMSAVAHAHNRVSALRGGMSMIAKQARQGKDAPVRATTGHRALDATASRVGRAEAGAIKAHRAVKKAGAKAAAPVVKGAKVVSKPVVSGAQKVTKPVRHVLTPPTAAEVPRHVKPEPKTPESKPGPSKPIKPRPANQRRTGSTKPVRTSRRRPLKPVRGGQR